MNMSGDKLVEKQSELLHSLYYTYLLVLTLYQPHGLVSIMISIRNIGLSLTHHHLYTQVITYPKIYS